MGKRSSPECQIIFKSLMSREQAKNARALAPKHHLSTRITGWPGQERSSHAVDVLYEVPKGTVQIAISGPRGVDPTPFWDELARLTTPKQDNCLRVEPTSN